MRFKIDENLPNLVANILQESGHDALTIHDQKMAGSPDFSIADKVQEERRTLITCDLDFADIRRYPPKTYSGIIVLRLNIQEKDNVALVLRRLLPFFEGEQLQGRLWIVDESKVRVRGDQ